MKINILLEGSVVIRTLEYKGETITDTWIKQDREGGFFYSSLGKSIPTQLILKYGTNIDEEIIDMFMEDNIFNIDIELDRLNNKIDKKEVE